MTRRSRPAVLHHDPPAIPAGVLLHHPAIIGAPVVASLTVGVLAFVDDGSALGLWDEPIQRWVEGHRSRRPDTLFRLFSRLGSNRRGDVSLRAVHAHGTRHRAGLFPPGRPPVWSIRQGRDNC